MTGGGIQGMGPVGSVQGRSSSQGAAPTSARATDTRNAGQAKFATSWKRKLLDFFNITIEFRPPKAIENSFLGQLWRRGAHYNNAATLSALLKEADPNGVKPDLNALTPDQAHRLRKNMLDHEELPLAIAAVRKGLEQCPDAPPFAGVLDAVTTKLKDIFEALSRVTGETGTGGHYNARKQDRLERVLWAKAATEAITGSHLGDRKDLQDLYRLCLLKAGRELHESDVREFGIEFERAPFKERDIALRCLTIAIEEETRDDEAKTCIDFALQTLKDVETAPTQEFTIEDKSARPPLTGDQVKNSYRACLRKAEREFEQSEVDDFCVKFEAARPEKRDEVFELLLEALKETATKDDAGTNVDLAFRTLRGGAEFLKTLPAETVKPVLPDFDAIKRGLDEGTFGREDAELLIRDILRLAEWADLSKDRIEEYVNWFMKASGVSRDDILDSMADAIKSESRTHAQMAFVWLKYSVIDR